MGDVRNSLKEQERDYGSFIASIMMLMMVEVCLSICDPVWLLHALKFCQIYGVNSKSWRAHFDGAWNFLKAQQAVQPWATPTFADSSTQSLCVIKIVAGTSMKLAALNLDDGDDKAQETVINSIPASSSFRFTIGAKGLLMPCISDIRRLAGGAKPGTVTDSIRDSANDILSRLDEC